MVHRTNRKDGSPFWGCRNFPSCRSTRDIDEDASKSPIHVRVLWNDATLDRPGWICRYTTAGGRLRSSSYLTRISNEFRQCWIARTWEAATASQSVRMVTGAIRKLIQRGSNPPIHPESERELLCSLGLEENIRPSPLPGDMSVRLEPDVFRHLSDRVLSFPDADFELDDSIQLDSDYERRFVCWVGENIGPHAARWLVPQASFDALTSSVRGSEPSGQRVDFLAHTPFYRPFVVEIDGPQHQDSRSPDSERDRMLGKVDIEVVRISTSEIDQSNGVNLERVRKLWDRPRQTMDEKTLNASLVPVSIHRLMVALLDRC